MRVSSSLLKEMLVTSSYGKGATSNKHLYRVAPLNIHLWQRRCMLSGAIILSSSLLLSTVLLYITMVRE